MNHDPNPEDFAAPDLSADQSDDLNTDDSHLGVHPADDPSFAAFSGDSAPEGQGDETAFASHSEAAPEAGSEQNPAPEGEANAETDEDEEYLPPEIRKLHFGSSTA